MIKRANRETIWLNRRSFLRRSLVAAGGLGVLGGVAPNLILNPAYGGTVVIVDSSGDKRISISNGSFARPFDVGTWSRLRVAVRFDCLGSGSNLTSLTPKFVVGLCSGSSNQVFDASTTNFFGTRTKAVTWTFNSGTTPDSYSAGTCICAAKRVGSTWTDAAATSALIIPCEAALSEPPMWMVDITKGSPNYTGNHFYPSGAAAVATREEFLTQMIAVTPTLTAHTLDVAGNDLAFDEVAGTLDHVQIGWDRFEATFEISDIAVVKMAE